MLELRVVASLQQRRSFHMYEATQRLQNDQSSRPRSELGFRYAGSIEVADCSQKGREGGLVVVVSAVEED